MYTVEVPTSPRTVVHIMHGDAVRATMVRGMLGLGVVMALAGCATPSPRASDAQECSTRVAQALHERDAELTSVRAEVAVGKISAAKQAAELQELRNLVSQLRQDNAASHQAVTRLQREIGAGQEEAERMRQAREQAEQSKQTQHVVDLERSMAALTQELDHLKQDIQLTINNAVINRKQPSPSGAAKSKANPQRQSQPFGAIPQKDAGTKVEPIGLSLGSVRGTEGTAQTGGYGINHGSLLPGDGSRVPAH
jgi:hypothetical protein